jgi:predicted HicB family RNase H-like nuclease
MAKQKTRLVRRIPVDVDLALRIEAAKKDISVNDLVLQILAKEAKRLQKKGRRWKR